MPESALRPEVWTAAKDVVTAKAPRTEAVLLHGDYQHFNVLWSRGRLSALVDWSSSCIASPDLDVGHCRLNLAMLYSPEIAERFRRVNHELELGDAVVAQPEPAIVAQCVERFFADSRHLHVASEADPRRWERELLGAPAEVGVR